MRYILSRMLVICILPALYFPAYAQAPMPGPDMIVTKAIKKTPSQVVEAIKSYSTAQNWIYMGANKVKKGEVTMVKVCIPAVGKLLWPLGLQVSAFLPCGNFGVYRNGGETHISMLHPQYMQVLYPHAEVEKAAGVATPLLMEMIAKISM